MDDWILHHSVALKGKGKVPKPFVELASDSLVRIEDAEYPTPLGSTDGLTEPEMYADEGLQASD